MLSGQLATVTTSDGLELKGFWIDNKSEIAVFHSHGTAGDFYTHKFVEVEADKLLSQGISFLSANNRGHDVYADIRKHNNDNVEWAQVGGAFEKFKDCILDIDAWIKFLEKQGVKKIILQAHSLTQKILYYQAVTHNPSVIAQIHISPCNDAGYMYYLLGEKKYKSTNQMVKQMVEKKRLTELLPKELAVVCPMGAQPYLDYLTEDGVGNLFPYHNPDSEKWNTLAQTKDPLLMIFGKEDAFIKPSITEAAKLLKGKTIYNKDMQVHVIGNASHSYIGFENELVNVIIGWVKAHSK